jgi:uncharacterized BrkB/YihY/UPF0761 family membrane protein
MTILFIVLSVLICLGSVNMGIGSLHEPGPGLMPFGAGLLLGLLSLANLFLKASSPVADQIGYKGVKWGRLSLIVLSLIAFTVFLPILGYLLTTFLVMFFLYKSIEPQKWRVSFLGAFLSTILTYLLFAVALKSYFPKGVFSF